MILTGTVTTAENQYDHLSAEGATYEGATYEEARAKLTAMVPENQRLIVIRTDHY